MSVFHSELLSFCPYPCTFIHVGDLAFVLVVPIFQSTGDLRPTQSSNLPVKQRSSAKPKVTNPKCFLGCEEVNESLQSIADSNELKETAAIL